MKSRFAHDFTSQKNSRICMLFMSKNMEEFTQKEKYEALFTQAWDFQAIFQQKPNQEKKNSNHLLKFPF